METVSICTIFENEEEHLLECLESVKVWVDEIVVADTVSTGSAVDIAEEHKIKV